MQASNAIGLVVAIMGMICLCGCASSPSVVRHNNSISVPRKQFTVVGTLQTYTGGAESEDFQIAKTNAYRSIEIILTASTNGCFALVHTDGRLQYVVGQSSSEGRFVLALLEKEKPWDWKPFTGFAFADNLVFVGEVEKRTWRYTSIFPDPRIESILSNLRKILEAR